MGLTRSPEISEILEINKGRIENSLRFLREFLQEEERITLCVHVTKDAVLLDAGIEIQVGKSDQSGLD